MPPGQPLQAFQHEFGGDGIDKIREQHDKGAALQAAVQLRQAEGEVCLFLAVVEPGGKPLKARELGRAALRSEKMTERGVKAAGAGQISGAERPGPDCMIQSGQTVHRFQHQAARVKTKHDPMVAFLPELPAQQPAVPGRMFPVDEAGIHARRILAQGFKFRALTARPAASGTEYRIMGEKTQSLLMYAAHIGHNVNALPHGLTPPQFRQSPGAAPAQPQGVQRQPPPARRLKRKGQCQLPAQFSPRGTGRKRVPGQFRKDSHDHGAGPPFGFKGKRHAFSALPPLSRSQPGRNARADAQTILRQRHGQIGSEQRQRSHRVQQGETPRLGTQTDNQQRNRRGNREQQHKTRRGQNSPAYRGGSAAIMKAHRGAAV